MIYEEVWNEVNEHCCWCRCAVEDDSKNLILEALEKQIPKKPILYNIFENEISNVSKEDKTTNYCYARKCPTCSQEFGFNSGFNYCSNCGQSLDWSEEK